MEIKTYLAGLPLLTLLLQAVEQNWQHMTRALKHILDDLLSVLPIVDLLDHALVDGLALAAQARRQLERGPLRLRHDRELLDDRLNELDGPRTSLNVMVIVMAVLLNAVESVLILILTMSHEARILGFPGWVGRPFVVQHTAAEFITAAAGFLPLTLGQQAVAGTQGPAVRQVNRAGLLLRFQVNDAVLRFLNVHETLKPRHQLRVRADIPGSPLDQHVAVDEVSRIQVAQLEELPKGLLVADELLHPVKEGKLIVSGGERESRWDGLRQRRHQCRRWRLSFRARFRMRNFGSLGSS